jgi:hypothetical protein
MNGLVIHDEPAEVYHVRRIDECNTSGMKQMLRSPAHFRHWVDSGDDKDTPAKRFGRVLHTATLEPEKFERQYAVVPADAPRYPTPAQWGAKKSNPESQAAKDWWTVWNADNAGRERLSLEDYDRANYMGESARRNLIAAGMLTGGKREVTMRWTDEDTGLECKIRLDLFAEGAFAMDLKSCENASEEGFARTCINYGYDLQNAHYDAGIRACAEPNGLPFLFLAIESSAPYVCQPHRLGFAEFNRGTVLRRRAMQRQTECLRTGRWPGYSDKIIETTFPTWAFYGIEE